MGAKQWSETYDSKLEGNISPALVDMIGSVRPKIYSIRKIIERDGDRYEMAKDRYKILYNDLPVEDRVSRIQNDSLYRITPKLTLTFFRLQYAPWTCTLR